MTLYSTDSSPRQAAQHMCNKLLTFAAYEDCSSASCKKTPRVTTVTGARVSYRSRSNHKCPSIVASPKTGMISVRVGRDKTEAGKQEDN